jgi:hypothetical protein
VSFSQHWTLDCGPVGYETILIDGYQHFKPPAYIFRVEVKVLKNNGNNFEDYTVLLPNRPQSLNLKSAKCSNFLQM